MNDNDGIYPLASPLMRLVAKRDIVGPEFTFAKGRHLVGKQNGGGWAVWARRDPLSFLIRIPDDLVRVVGPNAVRG